MGDSKFGPSVNNGQPLYSAPPSIKGRRVLVVDDNATNRKVLMGQLMICGVEPVPASSAEEALSLLHQSRAAGWPFDAALLDYQMPDCDGAQLGRLIVQDEQIKDTRLILLTSSGQRGDAHQFADIGFAGYLLKPVALRDLTGCLILVLAKPATEWHMRSQRIVTRHVLRAQRGRIGNRILVAEDNAVNQKVALRLLEKLDFHVEVVADGQAAVAAWQSGRHDLILMDCQMPVLDGYEATRQIRRLEGGKTHIPIVALTAHAMAGADAECRAAGMDDYLTKPIDQARLDVCLQRLLPHAARSAAAEHPVNWEALFESIDRDAVFAGELVELFAASGDRALAAIAAAQASGDFAAMRESAHALKGASANLRAAAAAAAAAQLEMAAESGDGASITELAESLRQEIARTTHYLRSKVA